MDRQHVLGYITALRCKVQRKYALYVCVLGSSRLAKSRRLERRRGQLLETLQKIDIFRGRLGVVGRADGYP